MLTVVTQPIVDRSAHMPDRPSWDCLCCGRALPCDPAREQWRTDADAVQLAIMAWQWLEQAAEDRLSTDPKELHERFMAWTR